MRRAVADRRAAIAELLERRPVSVEELAARFTVTPSTIRRDLALLHEQGTIVRTYGGALAAPREESLHEREAKAGAQKAAIAREAERRIAPGQFLLLDAGTTVGALAGQLVAWEEITVASNGLTTINALADAQGVELICLGGIVRHVSGGMVGPVAEDVVSGLSADVAFLGADGVTAARGVCEATSIQASLKRRMIQAATAVYVLADASKIGRASSHWWTSLPSRWTLITDDGVSDSQLKPFRDADVDIVIAS